jgi:two-component system LytT family sensor kinase
MTDVVLAAILGVLGGIVLSVLLLLARRLARGAADLGSDAEQAALTALHQASLAAPHLRAGLSAPDVVKAARHLRVLLGSAAVAIVSVEGAVSFDGPSDGLESAARRIAAQVSASGRRQVFPAPGRDDDLEAVGAPILVDGRVVGVVVAFAAPVRAALVRAAEEVADWCAAQVELGGLDASRTQLAEAELRSLRAQISPHFIYNALTAIASFVLTDPDRARELVLEFADFTRYSFRRQGEFTTLAEELGSIHSLPRTRTARFGDRLRVTLQIAPEVLATVIPFLSVQPLVENAVRHGLEPARAAGRSASSPATTAPTPRSGRGRRRGHGPRRPTGNAHRRRRRPRHVGLRNVDGRLRPALRGDYGLVVETNTGAGTLVRRRVPKSQPRTTRSDV